MAREHAFAIVVAVLGCASNASTSPPANDAGISVEARDGDSFLTQLCGTFGRCCPALGRTAAVPQCASLFKSNIGAQEYDPVVGGRCLTELAAAGDGTCADDYLLPAPCSRAFGGGAARPGESCSLWSHCARSSEGDVACVDKKCQVQKVGNVGDTPCAGTFNGSYVSSTPGSTATEAFVCDARAGAFCAPTLVCTARASVGGPCTGRSSYECVDSAYCDLAANTCVARKSTGEPCGDARECVLGAFCAGTCAPRKPATAACATDSECASGECSDGRCDPSGFVFLVCPM